MEEVGGHHEAVRDRHHLQQVELGGGEPDRGGAHRNGQVGLGEGHASRSDRPFFRGPSPKGHPDPGQQLGGRKGFGDVVLGSGVERRHLDARLVVGGENDHRNRRLPVYRPDQFHSASGHVQVDDHQVGMGSGPTLQGLSGGPGGFHHITGGLEQQRHRFQQRRIVVGNEYRRHESAIVASSRPP